MGGKGSKEEKQKSFRWRSGGGGEEEEGGVGPKAGNG